MPTATDPCKRVFSIFTIIRREPQRQIRDRINKIVPIPPSPNFKNQGIRGLLVQVTIYLVSGTLYEALYKALVFRYYYKAPLTRKTRLECVYFSAKCCNIAGCNHGFTELTKANTVFRCLKKMRSLVQGFSNVLF